MTKLISALIAAAALSFALAAPAAAQTADERYSAHINYADLNLDNTAGADAIIDRLRGAARAACGDRPGRVSLAEHRERRACSRAFVQKGVIRLENSTVARRYVERGGRLPTVTVASL